MKAGEQDIGMAVVREKAIAEVESNIENDFAASQNWLSSKNSFVETE